MVVSPTSESDPTDPAVPLGILHFAPDAHFVLDAEANVCASNAAAVDLLRRYPQIQAALRFPPPSRVRAMAGDRLHVFDVAYREITWNGSAATLCRLSEIADQGDAETSLDDQVRLLSELIDVLGHSLVVLDDVGAIVAANAQWRISARALGLALPDDGVGANYLAVCDAAEGPGSEDAKLVARGVRDVLQQRALSFVHEYDMGTPERPKLFRVAVHALHESRGAVVTHTDVSAIRDEQRARVEALAHFKATFENALDAMVLVDTDGIVLEANSAAIALLAPADGQLVGSALPDSFVRAADGGIASLAVLLAPATNRGLVRVRGRVGAGAGTMDLEYAARANVQPGRHLLVFRDVTELRRLENELRQAQKMEAIGQLTGGIAHDFNNILTVVLGNTELVLDGEGNKVLSEESLEALGDVVSTAARGADTVRKLLAFARKEPLRPVFHEVLPLLHDMSRLLQRVVPESIQLTVDVPDGLPPIRADASALQQVLLNLCTNARDAIGPDGGRIRICAEQQDGDADPDITVRGVAKRRHTVIKVTDDGVGMSAEVLSHLFEPFFTTKEVGKGTGLGMSMVYGMMAQHGGRVTIDSAPGRGTTVALHFPDATPQTDAQSSSTGQVYLGAVGGERILLIEDNPAIRRVSVQVLTRAGYEVQTAADGLEGATALRDMKSPFDLIISDVVMPNGGGRVVADAVQRHSPRTPILWITGYAADGVPKPAAAVPVVWRTLLKPWNVSELLAAVRDAVGASPPLAPLQGVTA